MKKFKLIFLSFCFLFCFSFDNFVFAESQQDELYATALRAFDDGFYDVAIRYLEQFLQDFPSNPKLSQVKFLLGQCYFFKNRYSEALNLFNSLDGIYDNKEL